MISKMTVVSISLLCFSAFAENGVTKDTIVIGGSLPLSGPAVARPKVIRAGADLFFAELNQHGGIGGRKIVSIVYDDVYDPGKTVENVHTLIEKDNVFALFQIYGTPTSKAVLPIVEKSGVPFIAPLSTGQFLREPVQPNIITVRSGSDDEAQDMVDFLIKKNLNAYPVDSPN